MRSGPGTQYGRIGGLSWSQAIQVDGKSNGWYRFEGSKWVAGSLVSQTKPQPAPAPVTPKPAPNDTPPAPASSGVLWSDNVAGWLSDPKHVPCGGLWKYTSENFYAREITCAGSSRYHALSIGQKVNLGGRTCKMAVRWWGSRT